MNHKTTAKWTRYVLLAWWLVTFIFKFYAEGDSASVEGGNVARQVLVLVFASLGAFYLPLGLKRLRSAAGVWVLFGVAYLIWSCTSLAWSDELDLSVRRLVQFMALLVGWIGLGAGYYGGPDGPIRLAKDFTRAALLMLALASPVIVSDLTIANLLNPLWEPEVRNLSTDMPCAAAFGLAATIIPMQWTGRYRLYAPWAAFIIVLALILYKSRSILAFAILVFLYLYTCTLKSTTVRSGLRAASALVTLLFFSLGSLGELVGGTLGEFLSRGNNARVITELNGRIPLWNYVWNDIEANFWTGTGFGAYWSESRMGMVFRSQGWHAPVAHNGYLDEWVHTGLIGLILLLCFFIFASWRTLSISRRTFTASLAVPWMVLFLALNIFDSYFQSWYRIPAMAAMTMLFSCLSTSYKERMQAVHQPALEFTTATQ